MHYTQSTSESFFILPGARVFSPSRLAPGSSLAGSNRCSERGSSSLLQCDPSHILFSCSMRKPRRRADNHSHVDGILLWEDQHCVFLTAPLYLPRFAVSPWHSFRAGVLGHTTSSQFPNGGRASSYARDRLWQHDRAWQGRYVECGEVMKGDSAFRLTNYCHRCTTPQPLE